jgi:transcriptional antiterminator NusG
MTDEAWCVVRNTPGVTGFIGSSGGGAKPFPLAKHEIDPILKKMGIRTTSLEVDFKPGDEVKILTAPFAGKKGKVESIDYEKERATVLVDMLGNLTPTELDLVALEKVDV